MTLVVAVTGKESIWLLADRRLSHRGRPLKEDARKLMFLETADGVAILGYAGLGATAHGTEPADWMSAVLRGRNLPLELSLKVLADAAQKQLPGHMDQIPESINRVHHILVPAFLGGEPKIYSIDLVFVPDQKRYLFRYTRHEVKMPPTAPSRTPRLAIAGSGALNLVKDKKWQRRLLHLVKAHDRGNVPPHVVADHLALLNDDVHQAVADDSVGPRCIVAWRFRKGGLHNGGGGHQFYTRTERESSLALPTITNGADIKSVVELMWPLAEKMREAMRRDEPIEGPDDDEMKTINAALARLPREPDENLY